MTDIRQREDVLQVYWYMIGKTSFAHVHDAVIGRDACRKCHAECAGQDNCEFCTQPCPIPDPITMSVGDLAFFMRDKCDKNKWFAELKTLCKPESWPQIMLEYTTPDQWVEAACKAWEGKAK